MQGTQNGLWFDEVPLGPRHWVAGGLVGYKHGVNGLSTHRFARERKPVERGNRGPRLQPRVDKKQVHAGAKGVLQPVSDGEWPNVVQSNTALSATAIHRTPACRHPQGCPGGGRPEDPSTGDRMEL